VCGKNSIDTQDHSLYTSIVKKQCLINLLLLTGTALAVIRIAEEKSYPFDDKARGASTPEGTVS
jgi:hypothetical protein